MRLNNSIIVLAVLLNACAPAATPQPTATVPPPTVTLAPSATPKAELRPTPRSGHDLVYHAQLKMVLLVGGGYNTTSEPVETHGNIWGWDGARWRIINADGPTRRDLGGVAYDSRRNVLVLYGGYTPEKCYTDTWEWDGATWVEKVVAGPKVCDHFSMMYDEARGKVVLFGGQDKNITAHPGTWEWDGETWTEVATTKPAHRYHYALAYDGTRENVLLFGGSGSGNLNDLWAWAGTEWQPQTGEGPSARAHVRMAYDAAHQVAVLFGGSQGSGGGLRWLDETWLWDGQAWTQAQPTLSPPARGLGNLAYDSARGRIVLFGGYNGQNLGDTWEWDGASWTCVDGCP